MKRTKHAKVLSMLCMAALLLLTSPFMMTVRADGYEPLEVEFQYTHRFTTNDTSVDSLFHYLVVPEEDAPLPAEADGNGVFTYKGVTGSGEKSGDNTVFLNKGTLTFTFSKPGVYTYDISADLGKDKQKKNADRYKFELRTYKLNFYIVNSEDGSMKLKMLTAEENDDVKPNEVIMDPSYKDPTKKKPDDKPKDDTKKKSTKKSRTTKTGDENDALLYGALMIGSALAVAAIYAGRRKKGSEDNA